MIIDAFEPKGGEILHLVDFYGEPKYIVDRCLITFSKQLYEHLLENHACEAVGVIRSCAGEIPLHTMEYKGTKIAFYLSMIGSTMASSCMMECAWMTGARKFVVFGSCGTLDQQKTQGKYIIPEACYREEGMSYHYAPPSDYIDVKHAADVAEIFDELGVPYIRGRVWTTGAMMRETTAKIEKRRAEGCIGVEMELAGMQAVSDFEEFELYPFLQCGDVLETDSYDPSMLTHANHDLAKLYIGLEMLVRIP